MLNKYQGGPTCILGVSGRHLRVLGTSICMTSEPDDVERSSGCCAGLAGSDSDDEIDTILFTELKFMLEESYSSMGKGPGLDGFASPGTSDVSQRTGCINLDPLYPGHGPEDIRRYPGHMTRDTAAVISWVICPGYLLISLGHVANHQIC